MIINLKSFFLNKSNKPNYINISAIFAGIYGFFFLAMLGSLVWTFRGDELLSFISDPFTQLQFIASIVFLVLGLFLYLRKSLLFAILLLFYFIVIMVMIYLPTIKSGLILPDILEALITASLPTFVFLMGVITAYRNRKGRVERTIQ